MTAVLAGRIFLAVFFVALHIYGISEITGP
jgi:hypothetical protein